MMVPNYILVEPVCCLGLGSVGQEFGVSLVEYGAMILVEQVVEAKEWEESCTRASTHDEMHSTEVVVGNNTERGG